MSEQATIAATTAPPSRGGWVYLDPSDARAHPAYGVYGWALVLLAVLFLGPMILLWQDVEITFGDYDSPSVAWILIVVDAILLLACWTACRKLGAEQRGFYAWFFIAIALGFCSLAAFISISLGDVRDILPSGAIETYKTGWQGLVSVVPDIVWWGIFLRIAAIMFATLYVMQSRRVNVTVGKRILPQDPFVDHAWNAAAGAPIQRVGAASTPGYGGSTYPPTASADLNAGASVSTSATTVAAAATATATAAVATAVAAEASAANRAADAAERAAAAAERVADRTEPRFDAPTSTPISAPAVNLAETATATPTPAQPAPVAPAPAATPSIATTDAPPTTTAAATPPVDDRRLRARLKQLDDARAAGLISDAEFEARRQALVDRH